MYFIECWDGKTWDRLPGHQFPTATVAKKWLYRQRFGLPTSRVVRDNAAAPMPTVPRFRQGLDELKMFDLLK